MKRILLILLLGLTFLGCQNEKDTHEKFMSILQNEIPFPRIVDYDIFCSDPAYSRKLLSAGLEDEGWVTIQKTQRLKDLGQALITFTNKSEPYLVTTSELDKALGIQKVRVAEEDLGQIINIQQDYNLNLIEVEYTTVYKNLTPFASLVNQKDQVTQTRKAHFIFSEGILELIKIK